MKRGAGRDNAWRAAGTSIARGRLHYVGLSKVPAHWDELEEIKLLRAQRLELLADAYGVRGSKQLRYYELAMALANDFVPGFMLCDPRARRGRPRRWTLAADIRLVIVYDAALARSAKRGKKPSERDLARWVMQSREVIDADGKPFGIAAIRTRLQEIKRDGRLDELRATAKICRGTG